MPAPDFARALFQAYPKPEADSLPGTLARFLSKTTGAPVQPTDFEEAAIDAHLRMNFRLAEREGKVLAVSRDLEALRQKYGAQAERAFAERAGERLARRGVDHFPDDPIPAQLAGAGGVPAYPAVVDRGESVDLDVFADPVQARAEHARGVRRLILLALQDKLNANVRGMGNLTYYGNPRVVNKSVSGIGSVVAVK